MQSFDPVGVAARDLQECLLLQLRPLGLEGTPVETLVRDHLRLLQNHRIPELAKALGCENDDIKQHLEVIKHLDPKPGSRYSPTESQYVIPDVYIVKTEDGYRAVLNEDGLPQLRISPVYRRLLDKGGEASDETRAYVKDKFRAALWLLKSVDQRQKTIIKVATSIINFQRAFLDHGIEHLRPLVLRDVATDIGMHESTVSRVVNNKYVAHAAGRLRAEVLLPQRHQQLVRRERIVGHDQAAHPEDHRSRGPAPAAQRLEDHEHPAEGGPRAGATHDREVPRRAPDSHVEPAQDHLLRPVSLRS